MNDAFSWPREWGNGPADDVDRMHNGSHVQQDRPVDNMSIKEQCDTLLKTLGANIRHGLDLKAYTGTPTKEEIENNFILLLKTATKLGIIHVAPETVNELAWQQEALLHSISLSTFDENFNPHAHILNQKDIYDAESLLRALKQIDL